MRISTRSIPEKIVTVALMPCSAKKFECNRPEMCQSGYKDVDYGLTTRELAKMIREAGIDLPRMPKSDFDDPFGTATGSGVIFGATGGVMEAAIRTVMEIVTGEKIENLFEHADVMPVRGFEGVRYAEMPIREVGPVPRAGPAADPRLGWLRGATFKVGVCPRDGQRLEGHGEHPGRRQVQPVPLHRVHGLSRRLPGRRRTADPHQHPIRQARAKAIYAEDSSYQVRKSHENPAVVRVYERFLTGGPCGQKSHEPLHSYYTARESTLFRGPDRFVVQASACAVMQPRRPHHKRFCQGL